MTKLNKYRGISLSTVPYSIDYLSGLALDSQKRGYEGICLICGELFPWSSQSKISSSLYYSEQEIFGLDAFCRKNGIACVPALDTAELPSIIYSLKGYEKICSMDKDDQQLFISNMVPQLIEDISSLLPEAENIFVIGDNHLLQNNPGNNEFSSELIYLSAQQAEDENNVSSGENLLIKTWQPLSLLNSDCCTLLFPDQSADETSEVEKRYAQQCRSFSALQVNIETADIHSRTGCGRPLSFWKESLASLVEINQDIEDSLKCYSELLGPLISRCWLDSWVFSRNEYYSVKVDYLKKICRQHIYYFQKR